MDQRAGMDVLMKRNILIPARNWTPIFQPCSHSVYSFCYWILQTFTPIR